MTAEISSDPPGDDLEDLPAVYGPRLPLHRRDLWVTVIPAVGVTLVLVLAAMLPGRAEILLPRAVGAGALVAVAAAGLRALRAATLRWDEASALAVGGLLAAGLVVDPDRWLSIVARIAGAVLVLLAALAARGRQRPLGPLLRRRWARIVAALIGIALLIWPHDLSASALWLSGAALLTWLMVAVGHRLGFLNLDPAPEAGIFTAWLEAKSVAPHDRETLLGQLYFEGDSGLARSVRFVLMMLFASVVSALGVLTDSTAVVVGAMLIAPLINPMMGMALSLAMGWPTRLARSTVTVVGGVAIAVLTGWCLSAILDLGVDLSANSQILVRTSPTIADLLIAAAAGGAGAYALSRPDLSASLPGVAVAIALVPPLSVVGVSAQAGNWSQVAGTSVLFLTNLVAILIVGGVVFVVTGVAPLSRAAENQQRVRTSLIAVMAMAALVVLALLANGEVIATDALNTSSARRTVIEWLGEDSEFSIVSADLEDEDFTVVLAGPGTPPPPEDLAAKLAEELGGPVHLDLQWVPRQRRVIDTG